MEWRHLTVSICRLKHRNGKICTQPSGRGVEHYVANVNPMNLVTYFLWSVVFEGGGLRLVTLLLFLYPLLFSAGLDHRAAFVPLLSALLLSLPARRYYVSVEGRAPIVAAPCAPDTPTLLIPCLSRHLYPAGLYFSVSPIGVLITGLE